MGPRWLNDSRLAHIVAEAILAGANEKRFYELTAWAVMPNHVHILVLPKVQPQQIAHWIKGSTAWVANLLLGRSGEPSWQQESYDHWARNAADRDRTAAYIEENPVSAGLAAQPENYRWSSRMGKLKHNATRFSEAAISGDIVPRPGEDRRFKKNERH
jgi:REP element-mobilizing transposase RayT